MDVTVTGRHLTISDEFRDHVVDRITQIEKISDRVIRVDVQVSAYGNKREPDESARVEITLRSKGPAVRAEASASDKMVAFEHALERLRSQLRKAADRKRVHRGMHNPQALRDALAAPPTTEKESEEAIPTATVAGMEVTGEGPLVVREKTHSAPPLTLDQALNAMELVGHDFYLFVDANSGRPSVVYRRKAYNYGVIHLDLDDAEVKSA